MANKLWNRNNLAT